MQSDEHSNRQQQQDGGRRREPSHQGGASKQGHLRPEIDARDGTANGKADGQIAQKPQQSSGQGTGQS